MNQITSIDNEKIKFLKKLGDKKFRDQSGQFLVENLIIIHDALQAGFVPATIFITEDLLNKNEEKISSIITKLPQFFVITEKVNKHFSSLTTPSGIAAIFDKPEHKLDLSGVVIYLNAINDPGNLGTILRTAVAFDIKNVVLDEKCADIYNAKTISAARDAIFKINLSLDEKQSLLQKIKTAMPIYASSLAPEATPKNWAKDEKFCLVLGNEANGVAESILKLADLRIKIEMSANIESLNVAVAAGILFREIYAVRK